MKSLPKKITSIDRRQTWRWVKFQLSWAINLEWTFFDTNPKPLTNHRMPTEPDRNRADMDQKAVYTALLLMARMKGEIVSGHSG